MTSYLKDGELEIRLATEEAVPAFREPVPDRTGHERKVYVEAKVRLILRVNGDTSIQEVMDEMEYDFIPDVEMADLEDQNISDWEVIDSK